MLARFPHSIQLLEVIHKTGHPLVFGLMAVFVSQLSLHRVALQLDSAKIHYLKVLGVIAALGALTEIAQIPLNRGASVLDVLRDLGGAGAALALLWVWRNWHDTHPVSRSRRSLVALLGFALILISTAPLTWCLAAYVNRSAQWPVVLEFGSPLDTYFIAQQVSRMKTVRMPAEWARRSGEKAAHALAPSRYTAGVRMFEPRPDWRNFDVLAIDVTNPGDEPLRLIVRVHDKAHRLVTEDWYNGRTVVPPRTRLTKRIPLSLIETGPRGRRVDMQNIAGVAVIASPRSPQKEFLLSELRLEPRPPA